MNNEMKFNMPNREHNNPNPVPNMLDTDRYNKNSGKRITKLLLKIAGMVLIATILIFLPRFVNIGSIFKGVSEQAVDQTSYHAVFLSNGQVYFGQIEKIDQYDMTLKNVYYLQVADNPASANFNLNQTRFNLIKLGSELHGPEDRLVLNKEHILFYEKLRKDSKVVESITAEQSKN